MNKLRITLGRIIYFLLLPFFRILTNNSIRTRVVIIKDNKILCVKDIIGRGVWTTPGGGLHKNEDKFIGAVREIKEEVGMVVDPKDLIFYKTIQLNKPFAKQTQHLFVYEAQEVNITLQKNEIADFSWLSIDELNNKIFDKYTFDYVINAFKHQQQANKT